MQEYEVPPLVPPSEEGNLSDIPHGWAEREPHRPLLSRQIDGVWRDVTAADWHRLSQAWRERLDARIAALEGLRDKLTGCIGCGCLSLDRCWLLNPDDEAGRTGTGARFLPG